jgi:hypothetical protein
MNFFAKAVITGFALSLGGALFKKFSKQLGLDDKDKDKDSEKVRQQDGATDPGLQQEQPVPSN